MCFSCFVRSQAGCVLILLGAGLLSGCALRMPTSEGIMFAEPKEEMSYELLASANVHRFVGKAPRLTRERYGGDVDQDIWNTSYPIGIGAGVKDRLSIGISPGMVLIGGGLDGTFRLTRNAFLTVNYGIVDNYEVIVQHRLFYTKNQGVALGVFYRNTQQGFEQFAYEVKPPWEPQKRFRASMVGGRLLVQVGKMKAPSLPVPYEERRPIFMHLRGVLGIGYSPTFQSSGLYFGIGLVFRSTGPMHDILLPRP